MTTGGAANLPSRVLVAVRVDAGPERAFAAFTGEIGRWWRPNQLFEFSAGRSGTLTFEPGPTGQLIETYDDGSTFVIGKVRTWDPPHHLAVEWRQGSFTPEQSTELHVRFEGVGAQTRVTIEHFGWDGIPQQHAARHGFPLAVFQMRFAQWWQSLLHDLSEVAAGTLP